MIFPDLSCQCAVPPSGSNNSKSELRPQSTKRALRVQRTLDGWLNKNPKPGTSKPTTQDPPLDPSVPTPDGTCHFLRLPLELLDEIYRIVLTEEKGLYSMPTTGRAITGGFTRQSTKLFTCWFGHQEANRLKYVCRQLWQQTRGLGLRYNDIHFIEGSQRLSVYDQFFRFVELCSPANKHRIRAQLHEYLPFHKGDKPQTWEQLCQASGVYFWEHYLHMHDMIDFCSTHPAVRMIYRPKALTLTGHPFLFLINACTIALALRGRVIQPSVLPHNDMFDTVMRGVEILQDWRDPSVLDVPNFRVLPLEETFDEYSFLCDIDDGSTDMLAKVDTTINRVEGGLPTILDWVSEWYKRGI